MSEREPRTRSQGRPSGQAERPGQDADTTGHMALALGFGMPIEHERRRRAEQAAADLGRLIGLRRRAPVERIHDRPPRVTEARR